MAEEEAPPEEGEADEPKKKGKGMLIGIVGALLLGGGGFYATFSGMILGSEPEMPEAEAPQKAVAAMVAEMPPTFVPIENMVISLGNGASARHLKFSAQLDVEPEAAEEVTLLQPRILDIINTYLRAVEEKDIEAPAAMTRLRAQMLRRVQIITGEGKVNDLLITEFILN